MVINLLNEALATELVCYLRYKRHYYMATGLKSSVAAAEFLEHANEEQEHADRLAERIVQLGGEPDFNPDSLTERAHAQYAEGNGLRDMVFENLVAERIAIDSYREIVQYIGDKDPTTRRIFEDILAQEESMPTTGRPAGRHELNRDPPAHASCVTEGHPRVALIRKRGTAGCHRTHVGDRCGLRVIEGHQFPRILLCHQGA